MRIYGIKNCDTVKKALSFLDKKRIAYEFIDLKKHQPTPEELKMWKEHMGDWPVNRAGRTFKQYQEAFDQASAAEKVALMQEKTSMIKRPILVEGKKVLAMGFKPELYEDLF